MKIDSETAEIIRREYIAGDMSVSTLAQKHDVPRRALLARAQAYGWAKERQSHRLAAKAGQRHELSKVSMDAYKVRAEQFLDRLATDCEQSLARVESADSVIDTWNYENLSLREQLMASLQRRGRTAFGLDAPAGVTARVLVNVQSGLGSLPGRSADIIDVESVPSVPKVDSPT